MWTDKDNPKLDARLVEIRMNLNLARFNKMFVELMKAPSIPGLGDTPSPATFSTGMFAGYDPTIAHQLPSPWKSRYFCHFGHDRHCRYLSHSPQ
jgi:hypothetical protein